jgi:pimeloyl-ACP methyl ester carboxylesterase
MKRFISLILSAVMALLCVMPSCAAGAPKTAAETQGEKLPLIIVRGMDSDDLIVDYGNGETGPSIKPVETGEVVKTVFKAIGTGIVNFSFNKGFDVVLDYANSVLACLACDKTGKPVCKAAIPTYPLAASNYETLLTGTGYSEGNIVKASIERFGADYTYYFAYDWRVNPLENCDGIAALIDRALSDTGCSKVNLVCASLGGIQTVAYLTKYGYEKLNKIVFVSSTVYGSYFATDLFNGDLSIDPDVLYNAVAVDPGEDRVVSTLISILYKTGVFNGIAKLANGIIDRLKDRVFDGVLVDKMGYIPSYWALVLPEGYESAIDYMFGNDLEANADFIAVTAELQRMVAGRDALLLEAAAAGVEIAVIAGYNSPSVPVGSRGGSNGDGTLETALMAGGANAAKFGKTLGSGYVPADPACLSPDRVVDTSGCLFPESTWVIKDAPHVGCRYASEYSAFLFWLLEFDGQPSVASNTEYPRFMQTNETQDLFPLQ